MKRLIVPVFFVLLLPASSRSQADTLTGDAAKQILRQIKMDTTGFLSNYGNAACKCIDSISLMNKGKTEINEEIFDCIKKQTSLYQLIMKVTNQMLGNDTSRIISISVDKKSPEFQQYYFEIERWLKDSCKSLNRAVASNNEESASSSSKDPKAIADYNTGIEWVNKGNFEKAITFFEKAVKRDEKFAFAWDNIGVCNRKLGNYDAALAAYFKSLEIDPDGITPLQNIPVVYQYQKKYDKALEAYESFQEKYPDDPEGFYGAGILYIDYKMDYEKALHNICKAYTIYIKTSSPYRVDAEKLINLILVKMKDEGKEKRFYEILKEHHLNPKEK
ncbi:MAG TPA: tetratricopeptide repeat protein [Chitinophagaceae bacterium]|nr:tetratricopeptide repeat protein [Chitinophagaceae bacterium]